LNVTRIFVNLSGNQLFSALYSEGGKFDGGEGACINETRKYTVSLLITTLGDKGTAKMCHKMYCIGNKFPPPSVFEMEKNRPKKKAKRANSFATIATVEANSLHPGSPHAALIKEIVLNDYLHHWYVKQGKYGSKTIF
jgi:hypothetical protein